MVTRCGGVTPWQNKILSMFTIYHQGFSHSVRRNLSLNCLHRRRPLAIPGHAGPRWRIRLSLHLVLGIPCRLVCTWMILGNKLWYFIFYSFSVWLHLLLCFVVNATKTKESTVNVDVKCCWTLKAIHFCRPAFMNLNKNYAQHVDCCDRVVTTCTKSTAVQTVHPPRLPIHSSYSRWLVVEDVIVKVRCPFTGRIETIDPGPVGLFPFLYRNLCRIQDDTFWGE